LVSFASKPPPNDLLGASCDATIGSHRVDVSCVNEIHSGSGGFVKDQISHRFVGLRSECPGAKAKAGDHQTGAAKFCEFHHHSFDGPFWTAAVLAR
jgi:hypothetical protein